MDSMRDWPLLQRVSAMKGSQMKGYIAGVIGALLPMQLLPMHPILYVAITVTLIVGVLAFWTGAVRISWR